MFEVGFSELVVIGLVALIVIGPERLPKVARTLGHLFGRMQRYVNNVKADISREIELDELRKLKTGLEDAAHSVGQSMQQELSAAHTELNNVAAAATEAVAVPPAAEPAATARETAPGGALDGAAPGVQAADAQLELRLDQADAARRQA